MLSEHAYDDKDDFKKKFYYFKSLKNTKIKDISFLSENGQLNSIIKEACDVDAKVLELLGLKSVKHWNIFIFKKNPGLILIRNAFTGLGQRYWIRKCLEIYPRKPNKTNLDIETYIEDWWKAAHPFGKCNKKNIRKLRWTTFGYHHNWDTKVYKENNKSHFPEDLAELCSTVASILGFENFKAQASIVNYYHLDSTISAHTDHSEINLQAPLFSFSFGQSAIFLIGGRDKSKDPTALLLNSGDIVVMSGEARLCYHAVPKILHTDSKPWDEPKGINIENRFTQNQKEKAETLNKNVDNNDWEPFDDYISQSRININVRQVLYDNQEILPDLP